MVVLLLDGSRQEKVHYLDYLQGAHKRKFIYTGGLSFGSCLQLSGSKASSDSTFSHAGNLASTHCSHLAGLI
jgi:hypothetical protein